ncbi:MAG: hypothetical protein IPO62_11440 [Saprospiraceae bacterium]|nr:hypothetical protein [Saprospiraceae bacterium]
MKLSNFILISSSNSILNPKVVYSFHLLFAIFIMQGCRKEYPCPTCFESIITCKVNGKEWKTNCVSNDPLFGCRAVRCYYSYNEERGLDFSGVNDNNKTGLTLDQASAWGGAQIGINTIQQREFGYTNFDLEGNCISLDSIDLSYNNFFKIQSIDATNSIIEGNFQFKVYNYCGDTATITDGYFKTKYLY